MVRIVSTGNMSAQVFDEDGKEIKSVRAIEINMKAGNVHEAKITIISPCIDIKAQEEFIYEPMVMPTADKKYLKALGIIAMLALMLFIWKFNGTF